ncbi:MAG: ankyrin repeat domain-containing protein [Kiritimatiellae bacterium]|nr:ankyrin repeat domain-containing protein [Kiritimatiellia bacterium]
MMGKKRVIGCICLLAMLVGSACAEEASTDNIWTAAAKGDLAVIEKLLSAGADVNATSVYSGKPGSGCTPLHLAVVSGQLEAAGLLLKKGADINARAVDQHKGTPLHWAAFVGRLDAVRFLIKAGANVKEKDANGSTPLGAARVQVIPSADRPAIVKLLGGKPDVLKKSEPENNIEPTIFRGSYFKNGEIHVNTYGTPEGKPLTSGHQDFKPSWSKTGDRLIFFRRLKNDPVVTNWKTAIHVINADGSGLHRLSDGTHTDFNQTWTRDGSNTPIWNRKNPETGGFIVMKSKVGNKPGQEVAVSDKRYHTWAYTCLKDGRILVQCTHPKQGWGYYLMTMNDTGKSRFERIECELAKAGLLDRVSVSPDEKKVCFEYQRGFKYKDTGRTLYVADFDGKKRSITNAKAFANELGKPHWYAYPRWTKDETAIVYHANKTGKGGLYLYTLKDGSTRKVSTETGADYRYPHCEDTPK